LGFLGLRLDASRNQEPPADAEISDPASAVRVLVIAADEELEMAREAAGLSEKGPRPPTES
jgi:acetate kinase